MRQNHLLIRSTIRRATTGSSCSLSPKTLPSDTTMSCLIRSGRCTRPIKKIDSSGNAVTIAQNASGETIDGASSVALTGQYDSKTVQTDGSVWDVIGETT